MGGGHGHDDSSTADRHLAHPVVQRDPTHLRPSGPHLVDDGLQPGQDLLLVGLVLEAGDADPALGVIAGGAGEDDRRPTVGPDDPVRGRGDVQSGGAERAPRLATRPVAHVVNVSATRGAVSVRRRRGHRVPRRAAAHPGRGVGTLASMPFDDDDPEEPPFGGPPLPPEDRLWRHPSEMGPNAAPGHPSGSRWVPVATALGGAALTLVALTLTGSFGARADERAPAVERVAAPAVATVPVVSVDAPATATVDPSHLVTVEASGEPAGTGVVLRSDGHVLTAASLVGDDEQVLVVSSDGERGGASVVGRDPLSGVAVLAVDWLAGRAGAVFGSLRSLAIGDRVTTASAGEADTPGLISDLSATGMVGDELTHGLVRTTSALPEDGVGGPVLDGDGHVVGLALWADPSPATWALPIDLARQVADDIIDEGRAHHSWLGIEGEDGERGPTLRAVTTGSPADRAGLAAGDVLTGIDDRPVAAMADVILALRAHRPGDQVTIDYSRRGQPSSCTAELAERGS